MTEKPWWESRAMWGVLIAAAAQVGRHLGVEINEAAMLDLVTSLVTIIGMIIAWIGRVRATRPISLRRVLPGVTLPGSRHDPG